MRPDVLTLYRFYENALGRSACPVIADKIVELSRRKPGGITVGIGYASPYLEEIDAREGDTNSRYLAFMPGQQGVCHWPSPTGCRTALVDEHQLPLGDSSTDRVLLVHSLEHAGRPSHLLREVWRVLAPGGQVIVVVPNRRRSWSAFEATPFGHGRPYSKGQLYGLMSEHMLPPSGWATALMMPPFAWPGAARLLAWGERPIGALGRNLGGALIVSAQKQVYGALPTTAKKLQPMPALSGP